MTINHPKKHLKFEELPTKKELGFVYMWVKKTKGKPTEIVYIGKAGKELHKRCKEQSYGFRNSKRGKINCNGIKKLLKAGHTIHLYARHSKKRTILGVQNVCLCATEEQALIIKFKGTHHLLNKT